MKAHYLLQALGIALILGFSLGFNFKELPKAQQTTLIELDEGESPPLAWSCRTSGMTGLDFSMMMSQSSVILIDWGDGSAQEAYKTTSSPYYDEYSHDYPSTGGNYLIQVYGCSEDILRIWSGNDSLTEVNLDGLTNLEYVWLNYNKLSGTLDFRGHPNLKLIDIYYNKIDKLYVEGLTKLKDLRAFSNNIANAQDYSGCTALFHCDLRWNNVPALNVENLPNLNSLAFQDNDIDGTIDLRGCPNLYNVNLGENEIDTLWVEDLKNLELLQVWGNTIKNTQDFSGCDKLRHINIHSTDISTIDISGLITLEYFSAYGSDINMNKLDFEANPNLEYLHVANISLDTLKIEGLSDLEEVFTFNSGIKNDLDLSSSTSLKTYSIYNNSISDTDIGGLKASSNITINISTNSLDATPLESFIDDLYSYSNKDLSLTRTFNFSGNSGTNTALTNKAAEIDTLEAHGWTVTPN